MQKRINDLVGKEVTHKKYGMCQVVEVIDEKAFKIAIKILEDLTIKKVIFSKNFFEGIEDYESLALPEYVKKEKRVYKKPDLTKYRRHPLVKAIDAREQKLRIVQEETNDEDEDENTED